MGYLKVLLLLLMVSPAFGAFDVPRLTGPVVDNGRMLSHGAKRKIEGILRNLKQQGGTQYTVLTVPDLGGIPIEQASIEVVDQWKLGGKKDDRGVLLFISRDDRKIRIEVGQGVEGDLTDAYSKRVISETMAPLMREGNVDEAVLLAVAQMAAKTDPKINLGVSSQVSHRSHRRKRGFNVIGLIIVFMLLQLLFGGRRGGGGGDFLLGMLLGSVMSGGRSSGFGGGGFGGGGGWSGGGGGFSGGGASGGW